MSLVGAMTVGTIASGIIIHFQKEVYDAKIDKLQGYAKKLDGHLATLESYKREIPGFWGDETGAQYVHEMEKQIQQIKNTRKSIDELSNLYDRLKEGLSKAQTTVSGKVDDISGILGGLTNLVE